MHAKNTPRNPLGPQPGNLRFVLWDLRERARGSLPPTISGPKVPRWAKERCARAHHIFACRPCCHGNARPGARGSGRPRPAAAGRAQAPGRRRRGSPAPFPGSAGRLAPPLAQAPPPSRTRRQPVPLGLWGSGRAGPWGPDQGEQMETQTWVDGFWDPGESRTHLREEAKEKWAGVLGEKFRGLSRGLLPVAERWGIFKPASGGLPSTPPWTLF